MCIMHEIQVFYCLFSHTYPQEGRRENEVKVCGSIQIFQCGGMVIAEFGVYFVFFFSFPPSFWLIIRQLYNARAKELEKNRQSQPRKNDEVKQCQQQQHQQQEK